MCTGSDNMTTRLFAISSFSVVFLWCAGCQTPLIDRLASFGRHPKRLVGRVACLYDARPWLNLDAAGDRDPEGIWYRVFLDTGSGQGRLVDGIMHVYMYRIDQLADGKIDRVLVGDWHHSTRRIATIRKPGILGEGYVVQLRWADKNLAGREIEVITEFEEPSGLRVRSGTKRLRIPKYPV